MAKETEQRVIYRGNSIISIEKVEEYPHPVVIKKHLKQHPSRRSLRSLEKEYDITRALNVVAGVRKALGQQTLERQPALILDILAVEIQMDNILLMDFCQDAGQLGSDF